MQFIKMQGAGNDFVLIDARSLEHDWGGLARVMCHRRFGVGADGILLLLPSKVADFRMRMFNPDGSEGEACGNGLRCFARYLVENGLARGPELKIETVAGIRAAQVPYRGGHISKIRVGMGVPRFAPAEIPMAADAPVGRAVSRVIDYPIEAGGRRLKVTCLSLGNPHAVAFLNEPVGEFPLEEVGPRVEHHHLFPNRVNFEIVNIGGDRVVARVWERGAGETLACGSGTCAIAVAARLHNLIGDKVDIILPGGTLTVEWDGHGEVFLSGPAETVFRGEWPG